MGQRSLEAMSGQPQGLGVSLHNRQFDSRHCFAAFRVKGVDQFAQQTLVAIDGSQRGRPIDGRSVGGNLRLGSRRRRRCRGGLNLARNKVLEWHSVVKCLVVQRLVDHSRTNSGRRCALQGFAQLLGTDWLR